MLLFRGSLRRKLLGVMLLTTLVAVIVALAAMIAYDLRTYHEGWVSDVSAQAELLGRTTAPALTFDDARVARENLELLRFQPKMRAAAIYGANGALFATFVANGTNGEFPPLPGADGASVEQRSLVVFRRIVDHGQILGTVYLRADYELFDRVLNYAGIALLVTLIAMLVAWAVSLWLQRIVTHPILAVGMTARKVVEQRDYSRRVEKRSDDELGALIDAFNNMMGEIEKRTEALEASNRDKEREVEERRVAQLQVMRLNEELEQRVQERTAQLERSNKDLALATAEANEANRAKSEFLSNMSHELRTPLNAILGFGQLLASGDKLPTTPQQKKKFADHIVEGGNHLLALINDVLNLAQIEAGKVSLSLESVMLVDLLSECQTMLEPLAKKRDVRLFFPQPGNLCVHADRTRLKQVLLNLLSNAVKYNRETGSVVVDCQVPTRERIRISVQDTGIGLQPDQIKALYQPFNRLGQETGDQQGTGIGLVVTKHLVELMGGEIGVKSTPGSGTLFWIDMLASQPNSTDPRQHSESVVAESDVAGSGGAGLLSTVLCVEDNLASVSLIQAALAGRRDLRLLTAPNGQVGVEMARTHRPDVILMDNNMPLLSGRDALLILRGDPKTADIPVIAISANAMPTAIAAGINAGFFRYVTKPIALPELLEALDGALALVASRKTS